MDSQKFVIFICDQVLPQWEAIGKMEKGDLLQLAILRQLAELSIHCGKLENPSLHVVQIFDKLKVGNFNNYNHYLGNTKLISNHTCSTNTNKNKHLNKYFLDSQK